MTFDLQLVTFFSKSSKGVSDKNREQESSVDRGPDPFPSSSVIKKKRVDNARLNNRIIVVGAVTPIDKHPRPGSRTGSSGQIQKFGR